MTRTMPHAALAIAALMVLPLRANAQDTLSYDLKTINFDLWCQEQAKLPPDRCDKRLPDDEKAYEAFVNTVDKYELPYLKSKQRELDFNSAILNHDPIDNPPDKQTGSNPMGQSYPPPK